jgi:predicted nuclease of predicted toxin-antitoxin system
VLEVTDRLRRFVLTHDADFARLAIADGKSFHGILHIRPGDEPPPVVIARLRPLLSRSLAWNRGLVATLHRGRLRLRHPSGGP